VGTPPIVAPGASYVVVPRTTLQNGAATSFCRLRRQTASSSRLTRSHDDETIINQPLRQIHLSEREICPNKRSHPPVIGSLQRLPHHDFAVGGQRLRSVGFLCSGDDLPVGGPANRWGQSHSAVGTAFASL